MVSRYVAVGSEDMSVRVVDVRTGGELALLKGVHGDVAGCVAFHPLHTQLASASYDGHIHFYCDPTLTAC